MFVAWHLAGGIRLSVKIRLRRVGATKQPSYRVVVADSRSPRDGRYIEVIGFYNPRTKPTTITIDEEKARKWLGHGARPSDRVAYLLYRAGIVDLRPERYRHQTPEEPPAVAAEPATEPTPAPAKAARRRASTATAAAVPATEAPSTAAPAAAEGVADSEQAAPPAAEAAAEPEPAAPEATEPGAEPESAVHPPAADDEA